MQSYEINLTLDTSISIWFRMLNIEPLVIAPQLLIAVNNWLPRKVSEKWFWCENNFQIYFSIDTHSLTGHHYIEDD